MGQLITDILYMGLGIFIMGFIVVTGIVGIMRVLRDIRNIKDNEQRMEYTNTIDMGWDIGITFVVFTLYIVGKVWIYHKFYKNDNKDIEQNPKWVKGQGPQGQGFNYPTNHLCSYTTMGTKH